MTIGSCHFHPCQAAERRFREGGGDISPFPRLKCCCLAQLQAGVHQGGRLYVHTLTTRYKETWLCKCVLPGPKIYKPVNHPPVTPAFLAGGGGWGLLRLVKKNTHNKVYS